MDYFYELSRDAISPLVNVIRGKNIVVWGTGYGGEVVKRVLEEFELTPAFWIDNKAEDIEFFFCGEPVMPPRSLKELNKDNIFVIISVTKYLPEIVSQLWDFGFGRDDFQYIAYGPYYNKSDIIYRGCKIGRYTYGYESLLSEYNLAESIGRFCSINGSARIFDNHPITCVTTHPMLDFPMGCSAEQYEKRKREGDKFGRFQENAVSARSYPLRDNRPIIIGHDVWIGANVIILPGIKIGNGAVVAAGAVVTKNIPPYAIVGGVPAKVIKYRFVPDEIEKFQKIEWWNWDDEKINRHIEMFYQPDKFLETFRQ